MNWISPTCQSVCSRSHTDFCACGNHENSTKTVTKTGLARFLVFRRERTPRTFFTQFLRFLPLWVGNIFFETFWTQPEWLIVGNFKKDAKNDWGPRKNGNDSLDLIICVMWYVLFHVVTFAEHSKNNTWKSAQNTATNQRKTQTHFHRQSPVLFWVPKHELRQTARQK